tara:strand:+ start:710 stop:1624 length:915 start_codon:yes stop_codon:yes gene_type:complete
MDINSKTLHIFKSFIDDLIIVFPEYKEPLILNYSDVLSLETLQINECSEIKDFLNKIDSISTEITDRNDCIFESELFLLKDICFKKIWSSKLSQKTRDSIWKYLQSFCLINININTLEKLNEDTSSEKKRISKKSKKDLENYQKINEDFKNNVDDENMDGFNDILENTSIGKIAKEITEELNIGGDSGEESIQEVFNPENMMKIFSSITTKMTGENGMDKDNLQSEAMNICSTMKDNPLFSQLMGMQSAMFGQMPGQANPESVPTPELNVKNINVNDRNAIARQNAKKKLDKKKNKQINVKKND